jgi:hypothetical protein
MGDLGPRRASPRSGAADPLMREVRWRLFRQEELPARLRRLERLERAAAAERDAAEPRPDLPPGPR